MCHRVLPTRALAAPAPAPAPSALPESLECSARSVSEAPKPGRFPNRPSRHRVHHILQRYAHEILVKDVLVLEKYNRYVCYKAQHRPPRNLARPSQNTISSRNKTRWTPSGTATVKHKQVRCDNATQGQG